MPGMNVGIFGKPAALHAASITVDAQSASVDTKGYLEAFFYLKFGTTSGTSASIIVTLQDSADDVTFADVTGGAQASQTLDSGGSTNKQYVWLVALGTYERYMRLDFDVSGTTPVTGAGTQAFAVLSRGYDSIKPATDYDVATVLP